MRTTSELTQIRLAEELLDALAKRQHHDAGKQSFDWVG
jgi:hypothetical protein